MRRRLPTSVAAAALTAALALGAAPTAFAAQPPITSAATPAPTSAGTTWALRPAGEEGPDGRVSLRTTIDAGAAASDLVALTNFSADAATFAVYASDGTVTDDGSFDLIPSGEEPRDGGAWVTVAPVDGSAPRDGGGFTVAMGPGATVLIPVTIAVPEDATPGDHPAGIVAELVPDAGTGVQLASRVGVRVHLRVAGDVVGSLVPETVTAGYTPSWNPFAPGTMTVRYAVANNGNVRLGSDTAVSVSGPFGVGETTAAASQQREVLPSQEVRESVSIPVWPLFFASGTVTVDPTVVGEDVVESPLEATTAGFSTWTVPWSQLGVLALIVGGFFLVRTLRARSKERIQARIDAAVAAATSAAAENERRSEKENETEVARAAQP